MPKMGGNEFLRELRADEELRPIPVIVSPRRKSATKPALSANSTWWLYQACHAGKFPLSVNDGDAGTNIGMPQRTALTLYPSYDADVASYDLPYGLLVDDDEAQIEAAARRAIRMAGLNAMSLESGRLRHRPRDAPESTPSIALSWISTRQTVMA